MLKDWGRLTERAFWYSKRAPNIAAIQAEGAVNEILSAPEIGSILQTAERLGKTAESIPQSIETQREALFAELDARQTLLTNTLGDVRHIVADADSLGRTISLLANNSQQTLGVLGETLKVAGSGAATILVNRWASEFATLYPEVELDIRGGGSVESFPAFLDGKVDLVPMSRPLLADEIARFKSKFGHDLSQILVAQDAIGVYVNKNNPIPGLTLVQLGLTYVPWMPSVNAHYFYEFAAQDRFQGQSFGVSIAKKF